MIEELKPCPFCGGDGAFTELEDDGYAQAVCVCTASGPLRKGEAEAIAAWNTAYDPDKRLREALEAISSQAICYGMRADEAELRDLLKFISETADAALSHNGG